MNATAIGEKRQTTIPQEVCEAAGLRPGDQVDWRFEDGEIRYKTAIHIQGDGLDPDTVKGLVRSNGMAMETYLPGIGAVITGTAAQPALERRTPD